MPIWQSAPVAIDPQLTLTSWQILETDSGTRHFIGADVRDGTGRVSSAISQFDAAACKGVTESGRVYQLRGPSAHCEDAHYVWQRWCKWNGVVEFTDVTTHAFGEPRQ